MIYFRTCAYNAEKTIRRTIESVLSQTIGEFKYYILENGSTDGTREIIREYAEKDSRIVAFYNKVNRKVEENPDFWNISYNIDDEDYLAILDADDYYESTFVEEMLHFMEENNLDVAACGSVVEDENGNERSKVVQPRDLLLRSPEEFDVCFSGAHWNMRQVWGKLYKGSVAKYRYEMVLPEWFPKAYGGDTVNVMQTLKHAKGFGVYAKVLHHYQLSKKSVSFQWIEGREESDIILDKVAKEFLIEKSGGISEHNRQFLAVVYINALEDSFGVLLKAGLPKSKVIEVLAKIFCNKATKEILQSDFTDDFAAKKKQELLLYQEVLLEWTISNYKLFDDEDRQNAYQFLQSYGKVVETLVSEAVANKLFMYSPKLLLAFVEGKVGSLISILPEYINGMRENGLLGIEDVVFAQNVSAYLGLEGLYIIYSKEYIRLLIEERRFDEAKQELTEWLQMMPEDEELIELSQMIGE